MRIVNRGFTLLEIVVAIAIGGIVLLGARAALEQLADTADRITATAAAADRAANADRVVRALVRHMIAGEGAPFVATTTHAQFASWCDVPAGWSERCDVTVDAEPAGAATAVILRTSTGDTIPLYGQAAHATMRYLDDPPEEGRWVSYWTPGAGTPLAIRIMAGRDTLTLFVGARR